MAMQYDNTGRVADPSLLAQQLILGQPAAGMQTIPQASQQFSRPSYQPLMTPDTYQNFYANNRPAASIYSPLEVPRFKRYVEPAPASSGPTGAGANAFGGGGGGGGYDSGFGDSGLGGVAGDGGYGSGQVGYDAGDMGHGDASSPGAPSSPGDGGYGSGQVGYDAGDMGHGDATSPGDKGIVCTAMNQAYGFGSYRNRIWLAYAAKNLTKAHEVGYHAMFLPLVDLAYRKDFKVLRAVLESIARHRSTDLRAEMRGLKRDSLGRAYRFVLEPLCYAVGKLKGH